MSSRRSGQSSGSSRITDPIMTNLEVFKQLIPALRNRPSNELSVSEVLDEICKYIRELQRQTNDLSEQISQALATIDSDTPQASILRSLLATIDSDTPQASTARSSTIDSDTPQASTARNSTIDSDTPQASTAGSSIIPDQS
ncbi:hypothetical protein Vadar_030121 [Vaccinium darrowii]|uniref:Uncharacterized protein n=1 Tax=Vaccinium darrowii TaxID=229202 RepID=A0ACB7Y2V5_9ERIC|nr:hypothetical protein Vadar_030121 [Vaccinium darrowii]